MKLCRTAFAFVICVFVPVQGEPCSCTGGCDTTALIFPDSGGRIVDVAYGKQATMSSTYTSQQKETSGPACMAVNGKTGIVFKTLNDDYPNCVHTRENDIDAWWEVDLGANHTVTNITIYNRMSAQRRMSGIHVDVDNQTCYTFPLLAVNATALDNLPEKIDVTCTPPLTGRVVRLQKRGQPYSYDFGAEIINICEVQVWGCTEAYVGSDCQCGHCRDGTRCDVTTLECPGGCDRGWGTRFCNQSCPAGTHGYGCSQQCGQCADSDTCNTVTGLCPNGCQPGWQGDNCKQECETGKYGNDCRSSCGHCNTGDVCHHINGTCPRGCAAGFDPSDPLCDRMCQNGSYGESCLERCGQCSGSGPCNHVNGTCAACQLQLQPPLCKVCIGNRYGASCDLNCSMKCGGSCEQDTGRCVEGCVAGFLPGESGFCNETCEGGTYGEGCLQNCGNCKGDCRHEDGYCAAGCVDGFEGDLCASEVSSSGSDVPLIAGLIVGVLALIALCLVLAIICIRQRKNKPEAVSAYARSSSEPVNGTRETAPSFHRISDSEAPKSSKPSAAVKPMFAEKVGKGVDQDDSGHIYYNTTDVSAQQQSTPAESLGQVPSGGPPPRPQSRVSTRQVADPANYDEEISGAWGNHVYYNDDEEVYASFKATQPKLDAVQKYLVDALASGRLKAEFATLESMPEGVPQEVALLKKNFKKNRFAAILPYDRNLVVLRDGYSEGKATDFVNASYVSGYQVDKQFIASQGPRDNTVGDLWRMIWQEQITHVVMLTNIQERGKPKCELYWPEEEGGVDTFGPVTVTTTHVQCRDDFYIRTLNVQRAGSAESREVTQYHYVSWPDHGAPTTTSLVTFWRYVHNRTKPADGASVPPVLVHCSAGVGRTGTYIGLEIGVDMAVNKGRINVLELVKRLRDDRCLMVQAVDQYVFLHKALLEAYTAHDTNVSVDQFDAIFTGNITSGKSHPHVDKEFQTLQQMLNLTPAHHHTKASLEENMSKNRNPDILPSDEHLVFLTEHVTGRNQYINAAFMPTFRDHRGSIVTQLPLPSTLVDFWRLVYGNDVSAIVSLSSPNEEQEVKPFCQYWPINEGKTLTVDPYTVTLTSKTERRGSNVTSYSLILGKKGVKSVRVVELLHYKGWTGNVGGSTSDILHLIDTLVTLQNTSTDRLVVQCSDGVGKSGLFLALCDIINRMTYDREVDVYMTVRHVQSVTPKALSSVTQYRYCYEVVQNRVREMSVYANAPQR